MNLQALKPMLNPIKAVVTVSAFAVSFALSSSSASALATPQTTYRLYNTASRQHLLTADQNEANVLTQNPVWKSEVPNFSAATCDNTTVPVYRMVNRVSGEHFLTADTNEVSYLTTGSAWRLEKIAFYAY